MRSDSVPLRLVALALLLGAAGAGAAVVVDDGLGRLLGVTASRTAS